jgi:hypothetical protein
MGNALALPAVFLPSPKNLRSYLGADGNATAGGNGGGERSLHLDYRIFIGVEEEIDGKFMFISETYKARPGSAETSSI